MSGGQTGPDRAALDLALAAGIPCGGWCPHGRWAEDGPLSPRYPLRETPSRTPRERTDWNVRDSDGTLVLVQGAASGGSALTIERARQRGRPCLCVDLARDPDSDTVRAWLCDHGIRVLNVAGPRESEHPGIQALARDFLARVLAEPRSDRP